MQRQLLLLTICCLNAFLSGAQGLADKLNRVMEGYANNGSFNGTVLVARKGAVLLVKGYGYQDAQNKIPNTEHTIFQVGSITEQITAEVILQLDSKGRLGLDDKVSKYLPDYPNGWRMTIKNLLTHTSGIYDYQHDEALFKIYGSRPIKKEVVLAAFKDRPLLFDPGTRFEHSSSNYFLLGCIIEQIIKWGYQDHVRDKIFQVCGMRNSGFDFINLQDANKAVGYSSLSKENFTVATIRDSSVAFASGDVYSTAADLFKWHQALHWYKLLPKDWQELVYTPYKSQYALGWTIEHMMGKRFIEHESSMPGFTSFDIRQEEDDVFIVLLQNNMQPAVSLKTIANELLKSLYGRDVKKDAEKKEHSAGGDDKGAAEKKGVTVSVGTLKKYVGEFEFTPAFSLIFYIKGGALMAESPVKKDIEMIPESTTVFKTGNIAATVEFFKEKNGKVNKCVLHQAGKDVPGERVK